MDLACGGIRGREKAPLKSSLDPGVAVGHAGRRSQGSRAAPQAAAASHRTTRRPESRVARRASAPISGSLDTSVMRAQSIGLRQGQRVIHVSPECMTRGRDERLRHPDIRHLEPTGAVATLKEADRA